MLYSMLREGCRVGFFGLGCSNASLLSNLPLEKCEISLRSDHKIDLSNLPVGIKVTRTFEGDCAFDKIDEDILFLSPSVRRDRAELVRAGEKGVILSSDAELFFEENRKPVFAVTGSDGKSTTATLIHLLLTAGGVNSRLIGNIGEPMARNLGTEADVYVCELSSFMLTYLNPTAERGCVTNITPNHLDWHKDFEEYKKTKIKLLNNSKNIVVSDEYAETNRAFGAVSDRFCYEELKRKFKAEAYLTSEDGFICRNRERLIALGELSIKESHNIKNLMMAIAMTDGMIDKEAIISVAKNFRGLPHRCERFLTRGGVEYINSSIDSTPERTAQTLRSLGREVVLILGGRSKGLDYEILKKPMQVYVKHAVIVGENAKEIYAAVSGSTHVEASDSFESAVRRANELALNVGALLLSPASTSFDAFKNYAERGEKFKEIIINLS